jgi:hypothetical protein
MKNSNDTIGNRTRDLPACSAVPQPTAPPRDPMSARYVRFAVMILERKIPLLKSEVVRCVFAVFVNCVSDVSSVTRSWKTSSFPVQPNVRYLAHNYTAVCVRKML